MQSIRTIRCRILVPPEKRAPVEALFERTSQACTEIAAWGRDRRESNGYKAAARAEKVRIDFPGGPC